MDKFFSNRGEYYQESTLNAVSLDISQKHTVYFINALASLGFRGLTLY